MAKLHELQGQANSGPQVKPSRLTAEDYLKTWVSQSQNRLRPSTLHLYDLLIRVHILPVIGHMKLKDVAPLHLKEIYRRIKDRGNAPRTVEQVHRILHKAFGDAVKDRLLARNVADDVDVEAATPEKIKIWNVDQTNAFIESSLEGLTLADSPYDALWLFLLGSGCRIGEAMGLRVEDVDWEHNTVHIERSISFVGNRPVLSKPKTRAGVRSIILPEFAMRALRTQRMRANEESTSDGIVHYFFRNANGRVPHPSDLRKRFMEASKRAGIPTMRIHGLRKVHPTVQAVQDILAEGDAAIAKIFDNLRMLRP